MSPQEMLREAAAAEQARYFHPFVEGPRIGVETPVASDHLLDIVQRRAELIAEMDRGRHLRAVQESA